MYRLDEVFFWLECYTANVSFPFFLVEGVLKLWEEKELWEEKDELESDSSLISSINSC